MKNYPHIAAKVYGEPWVITPERHRVIQRLLEQRMAGESMPMPMDDEDEHDEMELGRSGSTAVIRVEGIIGKHLSSLETMCGGCDLDSVSTAFDAAMADESIDKIIFDFRSPGGTVTGVPEMARKIAACPKETVAFTDADCCSGAYWLASQCKQFYCTESACVGSIGVYIAILDASRQMANEGLQMQTMQAGKHKLMGAYWKPLTDEERAMFQKSVDKIYGQFTDAVNRFREVGKEFCQGQTFDGEEAVAAGLVDGLVDDILDLLDPEE